jgi:hypothetical protein
MAAPRSAEAEMQRHVDECDACAEFAREIDALETRIASALQVPVPEGLADRLILSSQALRARERRRLAPTMGFAAAVIAAAIAVALGWRAGHLSAMRDPFIAHIERESSVLTRRDAHTEAELKAVFASFGGDLIRPIGPVRHLGPCRILGSVGSHVVIETPEGGASLLITSARSVSVRTVATEGDWTAVEVPLPSGGTMAVVAPTRIEAEREEHRISLALQWDR